MEIPHPTRSIAYQQEVDRVTHRWQDPDPLRAEEEEREGDGALREAEGVG
jgi:hypothetical protein